MLFDARLSPSRGVLSVAAAAATSREGRRCSQPEPTFRGVFSLCRGHVSPFVKPSLSASPCGWYPMAGSLCFVTPNCLLPFPRPPRLHVGRVCLLTCFISPPPLPFPYTPSMFQPSHRHHKPINHACLLPRALGRDSLLRGGRRGKNLRKGKDGGKEQRPLNSAPCVPSRRARIFTHHITHDTTPI